MTRLSGRLHKLEFEQGDKRPVAIELLHGITEEEAVRAHFGDQPPPEGALIVLLRHFYVDVDQ